MLNKIEDFLMNRFAGKAITRLSLLVAGVICGKLLPAITAYTGVPIAVSQADVVASVTGALLLGFEWIKAKRAANPNSPTVQTDASKEVAPVK